MSEHNDSGKHAEDCVASYLNKLGYKIIDRNWKTAQCEVDVIAQKNSCIYFVEVKYRMSSAQGNGFEYITDAKLKQMEFAANYWVTQNKWVGEYVLSGASVSGSNFEVELIEQI
jgi:Holliday junction resolvase-like predicted endonuclease